MTARFIRILLTISRHVLLVSSYVLHVVFSTSFIRSLQAGKGPERAWINNRMEISSSLIRRWKYPLLLSAVFLFIYTFFHDRPPSVSLSSELQLLQMKRLGLQRRGSVSLTTASGMMVHPAVDAVLDDWMVETEENDEESDEENMTAGDQKAVKKQEKADEKKVGKRLKMPKTKYDHAKESANEEEAKKLSELLERREIIGNDRFFNKFGRGIQRPEDFYERNQEIKAWQPKSTDVIQPAASSTVDPSSTTFSADTIRQYNKVMTNVSQPPQVLSSNTDEAWDSPHQYGNSAVPVGDDVKSVIKDDRLPSPSSTHLPSGLPRHAVDTQTIDMNKLESDSKFEVREKTNRRQRFNGTTLSSLMNKSYPPVVVEAIGPFMDRVQSFNDAIGRVRDELFRARGYKVWQDVADPSELKVLWGNEDDFLDRLAQQPRVTTILLPWINPNGGSGSGPSRWSNWSSIIDTSNVLVNNYYQWVASEPLCEWIETPRFTRGHWDAVYNRKCNEEINKAAKPCSLEFMYLYGKPINVAHYWPNDGLSYPHYFYIRPPVYVFYVNLVQDAIINDVGDIVTGDLKLVPYTCSHDNQPTVPAEYQSRPVYREVFIISQFWGTSFFHKMLEVMPRIAAYVDFLRANTGVQIHAPEDRAQVSEMLRWLGINPERVVTGVVRAKLAYQPQGTPCGFPDARGIQLLSKRFRDYLSSSKATGIGTVRNRLLYVRRSGLRRFVHGPPIEYILKALAERYGLNYTVFGDNPTPPLSVAADLFSSSVLIVGPHGAGLSNVVFCEPGTVVVEGVCNEPHVNMCYQFTSHVLGLRYHALPSRGGCERAVDVMPETVEETVEQYLKMLNLKATQDAF